MPHTVGVLSIVKHNVNGWGCNAPHRWGLTHCKTQGEPHFCHLAIHIWGEFETGNELSLKEVLVDPRGIPTYKNTVLRILKKSNNCLEDHQFFPKFHMKMERSFRYWNQPEPTVVNKKNLNRLPAQHCCNIKTTVCKRISLPHQNLQARVRCMVQSPALQKFWNCTVCWFLVHILSLSHQPVCRKVEKSRNLASRWQHARTYCLRFQSCPWSSKEQNHKCFLSVYKYNPS